MFDVGIGHSGVAWGAEALFLFLIQSWEFGIPLCRELACQYESLYDYQSLSWIRVSSAPFPTLAPTRHARIFPVSSEWALPVGLTFILVLHRRRGQGSLLWSTYSLTGEPKNIPDKWLCNLDPKDPCYLGQGRSQHRQNMMGVSKGKCFCLILICSRIISWKNLQELFPTLAYNRFLVPILVFILEQNTERLSQMYHGL